MCTTVGTTIGTTMYVCHFGRSQWDVVTLYVTGKDEAKNESKVSIELETAYSIRALDRFMRRPIPKEISQTHVRPTTSLFETERK